MGNRGFSIIEIMISIGVMSVMALNLSSLITRQTEQVNLVSELLARADFSRNLTTAMLDDQACLYSINYPQVRHFDATKVEAGIPQRIQVPKLYLTPDQNSPALAKDGETLTMNSASLKIKSIDLVIISGGGGVYMANWEVNFHSRAMGAIALKPSTAKVFIRANTSNPSAARIVSCNLQKEQGGTMIVQHKEDPGHSGQGYTGSWTTKKLNYVQYNSISGASLNANKITLSPGRYLFKSDIQVKGDGYDDIKTRLYNVTGDAPVCYGLTLVFASSDTDTGTSTINCMVEIADTTKFEFQVISRTGGAIGTRGAMGGADEVYANVMVTRM